MKPTYLAAAVVCAAAFGLGAASRAADAVPKSPPAPNVQIAVLLDTSNSMDGLIAQAKTQLWRIVNEFVRAKKDGKTPTIQVALFEYGKPSLPSADGFVRQVLPLTDDLDRVSEELFALKTHGGDEYCGWVIRDAVNRLSWSPSREVYKAVFIAGNEPFTQGPVDFRTACKAAAEKGILVNTIFCGPNDGGVQTGWKDGAVLADGRYMSIDQDARVAEVPAPQDAEIAKLGTELNRTYIPYGAAGKEGQMRQSVQDSNAVAASPTAIVTRSIAKGNAFYCNDAWDLVDGLKNGKCKLEDLKEADLPAEFRGLDLAARRAKVDAASRARESIQKRILDLNKERDAFLAAERKKQAKSEGDTLDRAVVDAIRSQATRNRFTFE